MALLLLLCSSKDLDSNLFSHSQICPFKFSSKNPWQQLMDRQKEYLRQIMYFKDVLDGFW